MTSKTNKTIIVTLLIIMIGALSTLLVYNIFSDYGNYTDQTTLVKEEIIKEEDFNNLIVRGLKADYKLVENTTDNSIIVRQYSNKKMKERDLVNTRVDGKTLNVQDSRGSWVVFDLSFLSGRRNDNFIEVSIPKDRLEHLKINQSSGSLTFDTFNLKSFDLQLGSGKITGKTIVSELIDINTSSGKVEIGTVQGKGNIKLSSGKNTNTKLDGVFDIKITSGKLNVTQFTGSSNIKLSSGKLTFNESSFLNESTIKVTSGKVDIKTDPSTLFCFGTSVTSGKADTPESSCKDPNAIDFKIKVSSGKVTITND